MADEFDDKKELISRYPALRWFATEHLPQDLRPVVEQFAEVAFTTARNNVRTAEVSAAIRSLLEGKDAAVRARIETIEKGQG